MARIRKRKYKNKELSARIKKNKSVLLKLKNIGNKLEYWQIRDKKIILLTSFIIMPLNIMYLMFQQIFPEIPYIFKQYILLFLTLPLLIHYYYLNFNYVSNKEISFTKREWNKIKTTPKSFWIILIIFLYSALSTNINKSTELTLVAFLSMILSYHIAKQILKIKNNIQKLFSEKDKFKMYMQLTNKILLAIITLVGSILTILLTIKQLLS